MERCREVGRKAVIVGSSTPHLHRWIENPESKSVRETVASNDTLDWWTWYIYNIITQSNIYSDLFSSTVFYFWQYYRCSHSPSPLGPLHPAPSSPHAFSTLLSVYMGSAYTLFLFLPTRSSLRYVSMLHRSRDMNAWKRIYILPKCVWNIFQDKLHVRPQN